MPKRWNRGGGANMSPPPVHDWPKKTPVRIGLNYQLNSTANQAHPAALFCPLWLCLLKGLVWFQYFCIPCIKQVWKPLSNVCKTFWGICKCNKPIVIGHSTLQVVAFIEAISGAKRFYLFFPWKRHSINWCHQCFLTWEKIFLCSLVRTGKWETLSARKAP